MKAAERMRKRHEIQVLHRIGFTPTEIRSITGCSEKMVWMWSRRDTCDDMPRTGRPSKLTDSVKKKIEEEMREKRGVGVRTCVKSLNKMFEAEADAIDELAGGDGTKRSVSRSTVRRHLRSTDWGKVVRRVKNKPKLTPRNIRDRETFYNMCNNTGYLSVGSRGKKLRSHVLFTDESIVVLFPHLNTQNAVFRTEDKDRVPVNEVPKNQPKVMVAGGICANGKTELIVIPQNQKVDGEYYRQAILPIYIDFIKTSGLFPSERCATLMHDNAPSHAAKPTVKMIEGQGLKVWGKGVWPGSSPDYNVIEPVWEILQNSVFLDPRPKTISELITRVKLTWDMIPVTELTTLVESFVDRMEESERKAFSHTEY